MDAQSTVHEDIVYRLAKICRLDQMTGLFRPSYIAVC